MTVPTQTALTLPKTGLGGVIGQGLGQGISSGLQGLLQDYHKDKEQKKTGSALAQIVGKPELAGTFTQLASNPELLKEIVKHSMTSKDAITEYQKEKLDLAKAKEEREAEKATGLMSPEKNELMLSTLNKMDELIPYTGTWLGKKTVGGKIRRETVQKRNEFDSSARKIIALVREAESRGNISKRIFEDLLSRVPHSSLTDRQNKGRLKSFRDEVEMQLELHKKRKMGSKSTEEISKKQYSQTATNPKTGQRMGLTESGKWELIK